MNKSYTEYESNLNQKTFAVPFKYLSIRDVYALGLSEGLWTPLAIAEDGYNADNNTVMLVDIPSGYQKVRIYRQSSNDPLVDFVNASRIAEVDLDTAYQQALFVAQEVSEDANTNQYEAARENSILSGTTLTNFASSEHLGDGSKTVFDLGFNAQTVIPEAYVVSIDGVLLSPIGDYSVTITPSQITFTVAPSNGADIVVVTAASAASATSVDEETIDLNQLNKIKVKDGGITPVKLSNGAPSWGASRELLFKDENGQTVGFIGATSGSFNINGGGDVDTLSLKTDGLPRLVINGDGKVTVNAQSNGDSILALKASSNNSMLQFSDAQDGDVGQILYDHSSNYMRFKVNDVERARIESTGTLMIGTTDQNPYDNTSGSGIALHGQGSSQAGLITSARVENTAAAFNRIGNNGNIVSFRRSGAQVGSVSVSQSSTSYNTSSDYRLKEDIKEVPDVVDRLKALKPCNFAWKVDGTRVDGFIAHEAQEVVPESVTGEKDALDDEGNPEYQGIDQAKLVPLLTAALQNALERIEALENLVQNP